jgi:cell volume regulation protein A
MEPSASIELAKHVLLAAGVILGAGILSGFVAQKLKVPDVVVLLLVGILIGPSALGLVDIRADSALNQLILIFGSSYILFDGGASLRFEVLKRVWISITVLATLGVLVTAVITAAAAYYLPAAAVDSRPAARHGDRLDRSGDAGADLPPGERSATAWRRR